MQCGLRIPVRGEVKCGKQRHTGSRQILAPIKTMHVDNVDRKLPQRPLNRDAVLSLRPAPYVIAQLAVPTGRCDQAADRSGTFAGDYQRAVTRAHKSTIERRQDLFRTGFRLRDELGVGSSSSLCRASPLWTYPQTQGAEDQVRRTRAHQYVRGPHTARLGDGLDQALAPCRR